MVLQLSKNVVPLEKILVMAKYNKPINNTRHIFLSAIIPCLMLIGCGESDNTSSNSEPAEKPVKVEVLTTTSNRSKDLSPSTVEMNGANKTATNVIKLQPDNTFQTIDGFGAAITGATAYNLLKMTPENRTKFLKETFSPTEGYGMSYVRVCIGCSDFSLSDYTCCDTPGIENFALTSEETDYVIPVLKEILAINPDLKIIASPWTAPKWMKVKDLKDKKPHDKWTSGHLNPDYYQDYATYFVKWIEAFKSNGIDIYSMTVQNEPLNRGNSASMFMGWDEQRDFIKTALGPAFEKAGIDTKIYAFDHNYNYDNMDDQNGYPAKIFEDPEASKYIAGAAYHNYGGNKEELNVIHEKFPGKELVFTESTAGDWNDGSNLGKRLVNDMEEITLGTVNRWCRGSIIWNLMLDSKRGPNRPGGCTTGFGAVDISDDYSTIRRNSFYYIMAHMSSAVKPGAKRIATSGEAANGITYAAFVNPDGSKAFVASNSGGEGVNVTVVDGKQHFVLLLPANSIVSSKWSDKK